MGTHPIFESDFDCLTEGESEKTARSNHYYQKREIRSMTFPFDGEDHRLYVGESYTGSLQYHSVKYDFKPPSIDFDKEGILGMVFFL